MAANQKSNKWPVEAKAYIDMLQHPEKAFRDERFQKGKVRCDDQGLPDGIVGGAAVVFRMTDANGKELAIRSFKSTGSDQGDESDRQKAYELIDQHIAQTNPNCLVEFRYFASGIRASKEGVVRSYPMVTMKWVNGSVLAEWLKKQCRQGSKGTISNLAEQWVQVIRELREAKIAHGDLQDANVMVTDQGELKLVDYDCMYVPEMGKKVNPEVGKPPYQHPERDENTELFLGIDKFSALYIYMVLRALAASPDLWRKYNEQKQREAILLDSEDFRQCRNGVTPEVLQDLKNVPDAKVGELATTLFDASVGPLDAVPSLDDVLFSWQKVESFLEARKYEEAVKLVLQRESPEEAQHYETHVAQGQLGKAAQILEGRPHCGDAPNDNLKDRVGFASTGVKAWREIQFALEQGDEKKANQLYEQGKNRGLKYRDVLADYPAAQQTIALASRAGDILEFINTLEECKKGQKWRQFVYEWDQFVAGWNKTQGWQANDQELRNRKSLYNYAQDLDFWRKPTENYQGILSELDKSHAQRNYDNLKAVWQVLEDWKKKKCSAGHPEIESRRSEIERLLKQYDRWEEWRKASRGLNEKSDRRLDEIWDDKLFADWPSADSTQQTEISNVRSRLSCLDKLRNTIQSESQNVTYNGECKIVEAATGLPPNYEYDDRPRVHNAQARKAAYEELQNALKTNSDKTVDQAWKKLNNAGGDKLIDSVDDRQRISAARDRYPLLCKLDDLEKRYPVLAQLHPLVPELTRSSRKCPIMEQLLEWQNAASQSSKWNYPSIEVLDAEILEIWREDLLKASPDAEPWKAYYQEAMRRKQVLDELNAAIAGQDQDTIQKILDENEWVSAYPLADEPKKAIGKTQEELEKARILRDALVRADRTTFRAEFDVRCVRNFSHLFRGYQQQLRNMVESELTALEVINLRPPFFESVLKAKSNGRYDVKWRWPEDRFTDKCVLAVCRSRPGTGAKPADCNVRRKWRIDQERWKHGGFSQPIHERPALRGGYVVVWAIIDVGQDENGRQIEIESEPLVLGRLS